MRTGGTYKPEADEGPDPTEAERLIELARAEARSGSLERAWQASLAAAAIGRARGDARLVARAAVAMGQPSVATWRTIPPRRDLCLESLAMLGPAAASDTLETQALRARIEAELAAMSTGWSRDVVPSGALIEPQDAEERFASLGADHQRSIGAGHERQRLEQGAEAIRLGRGAGDPAMAAWGRLWRMTALQQLGLRFEMQHELTELEAVLDALESPAWRWRLHLVHANIALLEHRLDDAAALGRTALVAGRAAGVPECEFLDLALRSEIAERGDHDLEEIEGEVRHAITSAPLFAQGWRALLLLRLGRTDEAMAIWRMLADRIEDVPPDTDEWLVVAIGHVKLAAAADDTEALRRLGRMLGPFAHLHVAGPPYSPYGGPVALALAQVAHHLGDGEAARRLAGEAIARSEAIGAPWYAAKSRELRDARRWRLHPLSARETEVADQIAGASTNREIAAALHLSERTVEQHVRSILHKLDLPNRAAVAAWVTRQS